MCKEGNVSLHGSPLSEPEPFVSLTFVKNDSYEKGNDLVVVHVYVKEIHKETSKVLFREQDFTLVFQTRYKCARLLQSSWLRLDYLFVHLFSLASDFFTVTQTSFASILAVGPTQCSGGR